MLGWSISQFSCTSPQHGSSESAERVMVTVIIGWNEEQLSLSHISRGFFKLTEDCCAAQANLNPQDVSASASWEAKTMGGTAPHLQTLISLAVISCSLA